ncbi:MAG: single-stranded DNA-binding protein [Candidatus Babeliales bacterium]
MAGYNRIIMIGNLTRDPDYRQLSSGQGVCRLGLASNRQYRNKQSGSMVQEVCFIDVDVFGPQAESCKQYLQKGRPVLVEGRIKFENWESPEGQKRTKHSIIADRVVFLSNAAESENVERGEQGVSQTQDVSPEFFGARPSQPKKAAQPRKTKEVDGMQTGASASTGEISLHDEPPFQDDLPF